MEELPRRVIAEWLLSSHALPTRQRGSHARASIFCQCFAQLARWIVATSLILIMLASSGCSCFPPRTGSLDDYEFAVFHPQSVEIYKPLASEPPLNEKVYIYLRLDNTSAARTPMCFAWWFGSSNKWWGIGNRLVPVVTAKSVGAPIVGDPEVRVTGISGKTICAGEYFPKTLPEAEDFPLNEANFDRQFCIVLRPDRRQVPGVQGHIEVTFTLAQSRSLVPPGTPPIAKFNIPVRLVDRYRPEALSPEPGRRDEP